MKWTQLLRFVLFSLVCLRSAATAAAAAPAAAAAAPVVAAAASGCEGEGCRGQQSALSSSSSSVVKSKSSQDFLGQLAQVNSPNAEERKHHDAGAVLPFIGLTGSSEQSRSCCKNGGTCILGSFCACPPFFTGRSCEYNQHVRNCGSIPHGVWVRKGCSYCRCGYSVLHCFPNVFHKDCDDSEEVTWSHSSAVRTVLDTCVLCGTLLLLLVFAL
ncbi:teratocarcinoma-derived growth factor 1 [Solea solea]|uniref:teratocarcinoma-derived growth factor 1 n=1 Tax=Solea solea TaxID=90069 RepID=UPI0027296015|nr:teratocarcinoma-derived growth factor 1 [Solea solea]